jgi:hypothetical protein
MWRKRRKMFGVQDEACEPGDPAWLGFRAALSQHRGRGGMSNASSRICGFSRCFREVRRSQLFWAKGGAARRSAASPKKPRSFPIHGVGLFRASMKLRSFRFDHLEIHFRIVNVGRLITRQFVSEHMPDEVLIDGDHISDVFVLPRGLVGIKARFFVFLGVVVPW